MKARFKSLIAAASFMAASAVCAGTVTLIANDTDYKGAQRSGHEKLTLSTKTLAALNALKGTLSSDGAGIVSVSHDANNRLTAADLVSPLTSLSVEDTTDALQSTTGAGGLRITTAPINGITPGGSLVLSDLEVDLQNRQVLAKVSGDNGVGVLLRQPIWTFDTVNGLAVLPPASPTPVSQTLNISGLRLTASGLNTLVTALGDTPIARSAWQTTASDFGNLDITVMTTAARPCTVSYKATPSGTRPPYLQTEITVKNLTMLTPQGWEVNWRYSNFTLAANVQNAKLTSSSSYTQYNAKPLAANANLSTGASTTFSFRAYQANTSNKLLDLSATVGGQVCAVVQP